MVECGLRFGWQPSSGLRELANKGRSPTCWRKPLCFMICNIYFCWHMLNCWYPQGACTQTQLKVSWEQRSPFPKLQIFGAPEIVDNTTHWCIIPPISPWKFFEDCKTVIHRFIRLWTGHTLLTKTGIELCYSKTKARWIGPEQPYHFSFLKNRIV